jgi:nicotinamidase/pyrazinamidase
MTTPEDIQREAFGIIDAQRGFMPAQEGIRLQTQGFGELPVPEGEQIVEPVNRLLGWFAARGAEVFTTQDWHPQVTAHFSDNPNFTTTWPVHCVDGTLGAEIHPNITLPASRQRFIKGFDALERGEDDTSYSGHYAIDPALGLSLPEWLRRHNVSTVYLAGLALDYCVRETAIDLKVTDGFEVTVVTYATRGITPESSEATLHKFEELGIKTITSEALLAGRVA